MGTNKKADIECHFEHDVISYTLDGVSMHPMHQGFLPRSVDGEEGNCSGISP